MQLEDTVQTAPLSILDTSPKEKRGHALPVFNDDFGMVPTDPITRAINEAIHRAGPQARRHGWDDHPATGQPAYTFPVGRAGQVTVLLGQHEQPTAGVRLELWRRVQALGDLHSDVFLACLTAWTLR